jgi:hypothetical protein
MNKIDQLETMSNIKVSSDLFFCTCEDNKNIYLIDPKTLALLETYPAVKILINQYHFRIPKLEGNSSLSVKD